MQPGLCRFRFVPSVDMGSVRRSLEMARLSAEGVCAPAQVRLGFGYALDEAARWVLADGRSEAGGIVLSIFVALLLREFGDDAFSIETAEPEPVDSAPDRTLVS